MNNMLMPVISTNTVMSLHTSLLPKKVNIMKCFGK